MSGGQGTRPAIGLTGLSELSGDFFTLIPFILLHDLSHSYKET